jgi:hypothetical protein
VNQLSEQWEEIMKIRPDLSFYLLHCTRRKEEDNLGAFDVLKMILFDGFLKATFAPYTVCRPTPETRPAVRGPYRAVCFTEQPLKCFFETVRIDKRYRKERYTEFAIAVKKDLLFYYGGRPVIYTDNDALGRKLSPEECENSNYPSDAWVYKGGLLPPDLQYLWVHYNPTALWGDRKDPVDFTHEREWRACPNKSYNRRLGLYNEDNKYAEIAVPLQLPTQSELTILGPKPFPKGPRFAILVDTEQSKRELINWRDGTTDEISQKGPYWERYASMLPQAPILSFEEINDAPDEATRLEDFINDDFTRKFLYPNRSGF